MKFLRSVIAVGAILLGFAGAAHAEGPFGIEMGVDPLTIGCKAMPGAKFTNYYDCPASRPHPAIESYTVQAEPGIGACWIKATGLNLKTSSSGFELQDIAETIAGQISTTYGEPVEKVNSVQVGSIWTDAGDWTTANLKDELFYYFHWNFTKPAEHNNVEKIFVSASNVNRNLGYPVIEFYFSNKDKCDASKKKREAGAF